ncbi:MAG: alpha-glucan family phosphorylase [Anaerolineae bacterium]
MRPIFKFTVTPSLPPELEPLREMAYNLWWCWNHEAIELFRRLDMSLWEDVYHNPVWMLGKIEQEKLEAAARDEGFLAQMERVRKKFDEYMEAKSTWFLKTYKVSGELRIAYFSFEFGLTESLPIYSGGLGVLAGDHLKSASDLGLPMIGVSILYQKGYFKQYLSADGWQQETYPINDFYNMPVRTDKGAIEVEYPGRKVKAQIWQVQVGRIPVYLLDTNLEENSQEDQDITDQLYGGDMEMRIKQEIMLGIGGVRALETLGMRPTVCHLNEGHSAFLALERIRILMEENDLSFSEAREVATAGNIFTTHTPVPAGIDRFPPFLMDKYFGDYYPKLGLSRQEFLALGRQNPYDDNEPFNMAILALRLSAQANGVSQLHGAVARHMWQGVWPGVPDGEVPITAINNGVHPRAWISNEMASLLDRYLGPRWLEDPTDRTVWARVEQIPAEELWRTHERRRERLVAFARRRLRAQLERRGALSTEVEGASEVLDPEALTIGFGRRFATYKRATLLFHDPDRLARILNDKDRPVQIIFAGKAHPNDNPAKELIRQIINFSREERFRRHIVFIEDYDLCVARYMVQGADVWLSTPRRPREASGTSGMKVVLNGGINMSILDGWWAEAYHYQAGWAIGRGEEYEDLYYQDEVEAKAIYDLLEKEVVPLFYKRGADGLPRGWIERMKLAVRAIAPTFNTNRMVHEYAERLYLPSAERYWYLAEDNMAKARALAAWKDKLRKHWGEIKVESVESHPTGDLQVGDRLEVRVVVNLGALSPEDVTVEIYHGSLDVKGEIDKGRTIPMGYVEGRGEGRYLFAGAIACRTSGLQGYALRILPCHKDLVNPYEPGLIFWAT